MKKQIITGVAILALGGALFAAVKYAPPAPALAAKNCVITAPKANFSLTRNANNTIKAIASGEYNYDDAWTFDDIHVVNAWVEGGVTKNGPSTLFSPETALATPSKWDTNVTLPNIAATTAIFVIAEIHVKKAAVKDDATSNSSQLAPALFGNE